MKFKQLFIFALLLLTGTVNAQNKHSKTSKFKSYKGLIMAGYQGWHNAAEDGAGRGWYHYQSRGKFEPGSTNVDLWPDVSEQEKVYKTSFVHADGSAAYLTSAHDASTVETHFRWMKEYGLDGVFMQRFVAEIRGRSGRNHFNTVLGNALKSSQKYGRAISVMYDLSGMRDSVDVPVLINDWKNLVDSMKITGKGNNQTYLYHNGKPLVVIWGVGFNDRRKYTLKDVDKIVDFLKNDPVYGGCSVMLGVPTYWREFGNDTEKNPLLHEIIKKADIVHPWTVGRYGNEIAYNKYSEAQKGDVLWCKQNKLDYVGVVFPGFSWHNMNPRSPSNQIPRNRGTFFWKQLSTAIQNGTEMLYVAMFDEIDEGTAIFKIAKNPPVGASTFVKFEDDVPSDYYLYLAGYAGKMLRKQVPFRADVPPPVKKK
ncbi:MAG TPA: glycoside hydrolase family 71/99-like protein [Pedobacter sp.]|uniref:glycoside hydrolase family 71/99-like protein n=1 Tax=Pedobacter sp. TaxID=1411316 RepID=UPI002BE3FD52|nr:glycoside hydrolase family 71/99-like protein [Pedobacter sp.]HMI04748.1 glycoside hydrolase family 71/99-like protein [Pedobacter sp.]